MRIAVVGGTGLAGQHVVEALMQQEHDAVVIARATGIDVITGSGLDAAMEGVDAVIDVTNTAAGTADEAEQFFGTMSEHLLAAEARAGVKHHIALSIVGIDRVNGNAHYAGKRRQEHILSAGPVPWTIQRTTQFFDFAGMVVGWMKHNGAATVAPLLIQPLAVADVATALIDAATNNPQGRAVDLAGPETQDLVDMARRTLAAQRDGTRLIASWRNGPFTTEMAGEVLLPGPEARLTSTTFDDWLLSQTTDACD